LISVTAPLVAGSGVLTLPTGTDTLVGKATTDTLTNKSIAASQLTGTIAAARLPAGSILQIVNSQTSAVATGTTILPNDNTIPQITEGTQFLSLAITPTSATSKLLIQYEINASTTTSAAIGSALFQDSTASAIAAGNFTQATNWSVRYPLTYYMTSGTTSSTTFTVRAGLESAGTICLNGNGAGVRYFGGVNYSSITITEIAG
jgi:hypothetical protein